MNVLCGDSLAVLKTLPDCSVNCCVTSPPYWGLRSYGMDGQYGLEPTPELYVTRMVEVFREVRRVLKDDATCWINLGDSYAGSGKGAGDYEPGEKQASNRGTQFLVGQSARDSAVTNLSRRQSVAAGYKPKDLIGIPWRVAFALQADTWYLRQDIIWKKPNQMPESVQDRCTKAHEYIFLLTKSPRYFYDAAAIAEPTVTNDKHIRNRDDTRLNNTPGRTRMGGLVHNSYETRNRRSVWTISTKSYHGAHFATFPIELPTLCIKAGCPVGGVVLDPFNGSGTTGEAAIKLGREYIGIELNPDYIELTRKRLADSVPLLASTH